MLWSEFLEKSRPSVDWQEVGVLLCLDPGQTTGWAVFSGGDLEDCGQLDTQDPVAFFMEVTALVESYLPGQILFEEYRVRGNKFSEHVGSEVVTIQNIGALKVIAFEQGLPTPAQQGAGLAKGFGTDSKLKMWGLYNTGHRHANDAIRHGVYYLLFTYGRSKPKHRSTGGLPNDDDDNQDQEEDLQVRPG